MIDHAAVLADDTVAIFLFHGVVPAHRHAVRNYTRKHLGLAEFITCVDALAATGSPVSMSDIVRASREGRSMPPRAFAVTFDDGFANNYEVARPVLRARGVPATFYVTSAFVDRNAASWIDRIEYAFERPAAIRLDLPSLELTATAATAAAKRQLLDEIRGRVKRMPAIDPYAVADEIWAQLDVVEMEPDADLDRKMTWDQVAALAADPLFEVGGHGHTHRVLAFLDDEALREEIETSLRLLAQHLGQPPVHYSYPEGLAHCYSDRVIDLLRLHGIVCAPTAEPGVNRVGDDLFRLRRITVA